MSDVGGEDVIGVRIFLKDGKIVATELEGIATGVKNVGRSAEEANTKWLKSLGSPSGGPSLFRRHLKGIPLDASAAGGALERLGKIGEKSGFMGARGLALFGSKIGAIESDGVSAFSTLSKVGEGSFAAIGLAAAVVGAESVHLAMGFQSATASIAASGNISVAEANKIGDAFLKTAGKAEFSATEISTAYGQVAGQLGDVAGHALSAAEATGVMKAAEDLAIASGKDLGSVTASIASVLQSYSMSLDKAADVSNILYNTSRLTGTGLDQITTVIDRLHGRLGQVMPSIEDTSALLLDLGEHGIRGARGTMVVQSAFATLLGGGKATQDMLKALGVNIFDSSGKFIGMHEAIARLQPALAKLPQDLQLAAEKALFGAGAEEAMGQVVLGGADAFDHASGAIQQHGVVQDAARKRAETLHGELKRLKAMFVDWGIVIGEWLIPRLEKLGRWLVDAAKYIGHHRTLLIALAGAIGGPLAIAMAFWIVQLGIAAVEMIIMLWPLYLLMAACALLALGIDFVARHWSEIWGGIKDIVVGAYHWVKKHFELILLLAAPFLAPFIELAFHWRAVWHWIQQAVSDVWDFIKPIIEAIIGAVKDAAHFLTHLPGMGIAKQAAGFLGFQEGGAVPGPKGKPHLAVVHGGEFVVPEHYWSKFTQAGGSSAAPVAPTVAPLGPAAVPSHQEATAQVSAQVMGAAPTSGGSAQPQIIQLVVDRKVLAQVVYQQMRDDAARG